VRTRGRGPRRDRGRDSSGPYAGALWTVKSGCRCQWAPITSYACRLSRCTAVIARSRSPRSSGRSTSPSRCAGAAEQPGQPRLPVQRAARLRQDHQRAHPGPVAELRAGPHAEPCGECQSCRSTSRANGAGSIDVIEIDAASHGGVDDARDLREKAFFAPASSRYKIYIIDEAHMVTSAGLQRAAQARRGAAGAPQVHLRHHRAREGHRDHPVAHPPLPVPAVPPRCCATTWARCAGSEGVPVEDGVLPLVVRAGAGSVRDSMSVWTSCSRAPGPTA
jgi:hypothetical protein